MCWTKLSCLFEVSTVKSSRVRRLVRPLVREPAGSLRITSNRSLVGARRSKSPSRMGGSIPWSIGSSGARRRGGGRVPPQSMFLSSALTTSRSKTPLDCSSSHSVRGYQKTAGPDCRVAGGEIALCPRVGLDARIIDLIRMRGVKYWPAPFLPSAAAFLQEALVRRCLHVHAQLGPVHVVDQRDELLE